jgi:Trefoil (P-type) domain
VLGPAAMVAAQSGCSVAPAQRVSCGVTGLASGLYPTEAECIDRGCCFDNSTATPQCFFAGGGAVNITDVIIVQACHFDVRARPQLPALPHPRPVALAVRPDATLEVNEGLRGVGWEGKGGWGGGVRERGWLRWGGFAAACDGP